MNTAIGQSVRRKEAWDKVTGKTKYTDDVPTTGLLCARLVTSPHAHARILGINAALALAVEGVKAVVTGEDCSRLFGPLLRDRPALARDTVRYVGEPVAIVVAVDEPTAARAARLVEVSYQPMEAVLGMAQALAPGAPLLHPAVEDYQKMQNDILPQGGTNIAARFRIRKGDASRVLAQSPVVVRRRFTLPPTGHLAMEVRGARAEITAEGMVIIHTASQAPYAVRNQLADVLGLPAGKIQVKVSFVGGGFGGKVPLTLEVLAYLASRQVQGRPVRLVITREQDMESMPSRLGLEAELVLGAEVDGSLRAMELNYWLDCGAYTDSAPNMSKAIAYSCTGPYRVDHVSCDSLCVYTNRTYATSYRGFSHESFTFCVERCMDELARKCGIDPLELRRKNALRPGDLTPSQVTCTPSIIGNLPACLDRLKTMINWEEGQVIPVKEHTLRVKGAACFWKSPTPPTNAISGALVTCNPDGTVNLNTGAVEMGSGSQTRLAQMLAEKLKLDTSQVHVVMEVDTRLCPEHWKTVASMTEHMAGKAVVQAADDLIAQLKATGAQALGCSPQDLEVGHGRVYRPGSFETGILLKDLVGGYKAQDGASLGEPALGRGAFLFKELTPLSLGTGKGRSGPAWTVGAQGVELEVDTKTYSYRLLRAVTVLDVGCLINPASVQAVIVGGMAMGLSLATREAFHYHETGELRTPNLRTYKVLHPGQEPTYRVGFVETPEEDSPYGVRGYSEHGILGIPAALGNALSTALGSELTRLPLTPEGLWRSCQGGEA